MGSAANETVDLLYNANQKVYVLIPAAEHSQLVRASPLRKSPRGEASSSNDAHTPGMLRLRKKLQDLEEEGLDKAPSEILTTPSRGA